MSEFKFGLFRVSLVSSFYDTVQGPRDDRSASLVHVGANGAIGNFSRSNMLLLLLLRVDSRSTIM
jgi:hypothetical protein